MIDPRKHLFGIAALSEQQLCTTLSCRSNTALWTGPYKVRMTTKSSQKVLGCADQRWRCPGHKLVCEGCCWAVGPMRIGTPSY